MNLEVARAVTFTSVFTLEPQMLVKVVSESGNKTMYAELRRGALKHALIGFMPKAVRTLCQ